MVARRISVIITTLAAQAYGGESGVFDALQKILHEMLSYIETANGKYCIPNPSNPQENFADKWNVEPAKAQAFFTWLKAAIHDISAVTPTIVNDYTALEEALGDNVVGRAVTATVPTAQGMVLTEATYATPVISTALAVTHRKKPPFKLPKYRSLGIKATVTENGVPRPY